MPLTRRIVVALAPVVLTAHNAEEAVAFHRMWPQWKTGWWLLLALESAMGINVIAHVASALLLFGGYGPGLVTALALDAPFAWYFLARARRERWVSERAWRASFVGGAVLHGPVLLGGLWLVSVLA